MEHEKKIHIRNTKPSYPNHPYALSALLEPEYLRRGKVLVKIEVANILKDGVILGFCQQDRQKQRKVKLPELCLW